MWDSEGADVVKRWLLGTGARRTGHRSCLWAVATLVAIGGCTGEMEVDQNRVAVRDSMGVLISENSDSVGGVVWTVREEPTLTIGEDLRASAEYQFESISDAIRLPEGGVLVADVGDNTLRAYRENGTYVATWGREGEGPGELTRFGSLHRLGADSVVVWDRGLQRLTVFDMTGGVGRVSSVREAPELRLRGAIGQDRLVFERVCGIRIHRVRTHGDPRRARWPGGISAATGSR